MSQFNLAALLVAVLWSHTLLLWFCGTLFGAIAFLSIYTIPSIARRAWRQEHGAWGDVPAHQLAWLDHDFTPPAARLGTRSGLDGLPLAHKTRQLRHNLLSAARIVESDPLPDTATQW